jgi:hypothetical protein
MCSREDCHGNNETKTARLVELWSELLELRQKVEQAEAKNKQKNSDRESRPKDN